MKKIIFGFLLLLFGFVFLLSLLLQLAVVSIVLVSAAFSSVSAGHTPAPDKPLCAEGVPSSAAERLGSPALHFPGTGNSVLTLSSAILLLSAFKKK